MSMSTLSPIARSAAPVDYPDCDGNLMSDNTTHGDAIEYFHGVVDSVIADDPYTFAAADHLWYFREGDPTARVAPDTYVVFGRPKGHRGRYLQWEEEGIAPQVVFEVVSPRNRQATSDKVFLYDALGVEEYYIYDPGYSRRGRLDMSRRSLRGFRRNGARKAELVDDFIGASSPRLGIGFGWDASGLLLLTRPDGSPYPRYVEAVAEAAQATARAAEATARANALLATLDRLREAGIDIDAIAARGTPTS